MDCRSGPPEKDRVTRARDTNGYLVLRFRLRVRVRDRVRARVRARVRLWVGIGDRIDVISRLPLPMGPSRRYVPGTT